MVPKFLSLILREGEDKAFLVGADGRGLRQIERVEGSVDWFELVRRYENGFISVA